MVFFQAVLLLGYLYAHALSGASRRAGSGWCTPACSLPPAPCCRCRLTSGSRVGDSRWWALRVLAATVGLPFFALSATAPLLQHWFSRTSDRRARDPYFSMPEQRRQPAGVAGISAGRSRLRRGVRK